MRRIVVDSARALTGAALAVTALLIMARPSAALESLDLSVTGPGQDLADDLRAVSLLVSQQAAGQTDAESLFAAARSDYARLLGALYAQGYYGPVISITLDGREAAAIAPLDAPARIGRIVLHIDSGPRFRFSEARIAPLAPGTTLPESFAPGEVALSGTIDEALDTATLAWREASHARVRVNREELVADHGRNTLFADIGLDPGPSLRFGPVAVSGNMRMRAARVAKIAGLREGTPFSQSEIDLATARLRRSGIFSSVVLTEGDTILPGDRLPIGIGVVEQKPRHYSLGAELSSSEGLGLTGTWMHRNLMGGGERLRIEGSVTNIGARDSGADYTFSIGLERPATFDPDTNAGVTLSLGRLDEIDYLATGATFGVSLTHFFSDRLTARAGLQYEYVTGRDAGGHFDFRDLALPLGVTWDRRDNATDARRGFYIDAGAKPFAGFGATDSAVTLTFDARGYRSFGEARGVTLAARIQGGAIAGGTLSGTPRDELFLAGGGGTVRGLPFRSLGITVSRGGEDVLIGGTHLLATSVELRGRVTDSIGIVAFYDWARVGADGFFGGIGAEASGAGLGLRYATPIGPLRLDLATPVSGGEKGVQVYVGLGQAF